MRVNASKILLTILLLVFKQRSFTYTTFPFLQNKKLSSVFAVSRKDSYDVTLLPGDGIGPEISSATQNVISSLCHRFDFNINIKEGLIGGCAIDAVNDPFPEETLYMCRESDSVMLACIGGPKWDNLNRDLRPETGLLRMRKELNLFANLRPVKTIDSLLESSTLKKEVIKNVDIMVVRELTGDVYFGSPRGVDKNMNGEKIAYNNMIYSESEIRRIAHMAGDLSRKRTGKLCSVDKANVLDVSQLWRDVVSNEITSNYPDLELSHMYVDNAAMQLIRYPKQFDTLVCGNIFGDIISDEASMLVGSLGMLPSASIGVSGPGVFEPIHGSAPDIAGQDTANPLAMILSVAMMLRYDLDRPKEAQVIENAVDMALGMGLRTQDIKVEGDDCKVVGCMTMGKTVANLVESQNF